MVTEWRNFLCTTPELPTQGKNRTLKTANCLVFLLTDEFEGIDGEKWSSASLIQVRFGSRDCSLWVERLLINEELAEHIFWRESRGDCFVLPQSALGASSSPERWQGENKQWDEKICRRQMRWTLDRQQPGNCLCVMLYNWDQQEKERSFSKLEEWSQRPIPQEFD